jgi:hypothetical protein
MRSEPTEVGSRWVNQLSGMKQIRLRATQPISGFYPPFSFGQYGGPFPAQLAVFHDSVDGPEQLGDVANGRVTLVDWRRSSGLIFTWTPDDEMNAIPR